MRASARGSAARSSSSSNVAASTAARRGWRVRPASAGRRAASGRGLRCVQWAEGDECASECCAGFYNNMTQYVEGRCRRCWDRTELALHAGLEQQFFALFACNSVINSTSNTLWAPCAQESGARIARTARLRVAAGVLRDQLPTAVAEHARAQQHRRGHLRPLRRGAWEAGRAKHVVTTHSEKIHRETYTFRTSPY